jgi:hypothetical protein
MIRWWDADIDYYSVVHATFGSGVARQLSPPRSHDGLSIGGLAFDDQYFYWIERPEKGYTSQLVRYPRGKYDESFVVDE